MIALVVDSALRTLLVACIAGAALRMLRVRNPYLLKMLWTAVLVIGLLMPLLLRGLQLRVMAAPMSSAVIAAMSIADPVASVPQSSLHLIEGLYAVISLALLGRLAIGIGRLWYVRRRAVRLERTWVARSSAGGLDVRASPILASPVTFGSTILLPSDCVKWSSTMRAAVLAHERSHVEQRDAYVRWLALLHVAAFWFSPLAWWLLRHLAALAEQTSDESVLREGSDRADYACVLLEFARAGSRLRPAAAMAAGGVAQRIERIVSGAPIHARLSAWKRAAVITLVLPAAVLAASLWRPDVTQPGAVASNWAQAGSSPATAGSRPLRIAQVSSAVPKVVSWIHLDHYYPRRAKHAGVEGIVQLAVALDGAAHPTGVTILSEQPPGHGFGAAASSAAEEALRYSNPTGRPARLVFDVKFALTR